MDEEPKKPKRWYRGKVADMLRADGLVPLPRMWVRKEQMAEIMALCQQNEDHVNLVRRYCRKLEEEEAQKKRDKEAAWKLMKE